MPQFLKYGSVVRNDENEEIEKKKKNSRLFEYGYYYLRIPIK